MAEEEKSALQKTIALNIHPKHDDIAVFEMAEVELELDRLYSKEELECKDYESVNISGQEFESIIATREDLKG